MKLTDICEFQGGSQPPKNEWSDEPRDGYIRMLQIRDYTQENSKIEYIKVTNSTKMCEEKDILIARYGASIGKILTGLSGAYNVAMMKVIIDEKRIDRNYIYNFFKSNIFQRYIKNVGQRAAQAGFNKEELSKININLPNLDEQRKITQKIDKMTTIIATRKKQISELDKLIKSQFVEMFEKHNFKKCELKDVANIGSSKRIYANEYKEKGVPFYRSKEIRELGSGLKPSIELFISEDKYDEVKQKYGVPKKGDILIAAIGATIGYMWVVDDSKFYYKDGNLILISIEKDINSTYLRYCLDSIIADFKGKNASGSAQLAMTIEKVEKFSISVPPIELQNKFADFVKQVDKQKFEIQKSLEEMQLLQDSLMDKYFG